MTIAELREKCKSQLAKVPKDALILLVVILASVASFGLGYQAGIDTGQGSAATGPYMPIAHDESSAGHLVASKTGTKYYLPWCAGAAKISEENKIWFTSPDTAQQAGYTPAANCNGL